MADEEINVFLNGCKLGCYSESFISNGYDDLNQILEMNKEDLNNLKDDVGITLKGHVMRFDAAVTAKKSLLHNPLCVEASANTSVASSSRNIADNVPVSDATKLPPLVNDIIVPNPLTDRQKLMNDITLELYRDSYTLMEAHQFNISRI